MVASFGDKYKSPYRKLVTAMQTNETDFSWNTTTAHLLLEFNEQSLRGSLSGTSGAVYSTLLKALQLSKFLGLKRKYAPKSKKVFENPRCFGPLQVRHTTRHCLKKKESESSLEKNTFDVSAEYASMLMAFLNMVPTQKLYNDAASLYNF